MNPFEAKQRLNRLQELRNRGLITRGEFSRGARAILERHVDWLDQAEAKAEAEATYVA